MHAIRNNRSIFIVLFIATAAAMLGMGIIEPILPIYAKSMGAGATMVGIVFAGFALSRGIFAPIIGHYSDMKGRKKFIVNGLILYTIFSVAYAFSYTPWLLLLVRLAQGFASVMITPVAQSYIGDITPKGKEGTYMNLFFISMFTGAAIGPSIGGYLSDRFSLNAPFYAMAVMGLLALLFVIVFVPESQATGKAVNKANNGLFGSFAALVKDKPMKGMMLFMVSRGFSRWGFNTFFPLYALRFLSLSKTGIGIFLSTYMLTGSIMQYPAGILADKYAKYRKEMILYGGILSALPLFFIPFSTNAMFIFLAVVWISVTSAFARSSAIAIRTERGRIYGMGSATGAFTASISMGQVAGPVVFGIIVSLLNLPAAFIFGGIVGLVGAWIGFRYLRLEDPK